MKALLRLAAHPDAPGCVLAAITAALEQAPLACDGDLRAALLTHPNTPTGALDFLLDDATQPSAWPPPTIRAAATRPGPLHPRVRTLLTDNSFRGDVILALRHADSAQVERLLERVAADESTRHTIVPALIDTTALTPQRAADLACTLALDPRPQPAVRTWLNSILERRAPERTRELAAALAELVSGPMQADLREVAARAEQRTYINSLIAAGAAAAGSPDAWLEALRAHADVDATLARAALAAEPTEQVLLAVASDERIPPHARRDAALRLRAKHAETGRIWRPEGVHLTTLLTGADPDDLARFAAGAQTWLEVRELLSRPDLPTSAVDTCWEQVSSWSWSREDPPAVEVAARFATHPNVSDRLRALAASLPATDTEPALTHWGSLLHVTGAHSPSVPDELGRALPARALTWDSTGLPGLDRALTAALAGALPAIGDPQHAAALVTLAEDFTGTVAELLDVATTVSAPR